MPLGISATAGSVGSGIAPMGPTVLMLAFGWRMMFVTMGAIGLAAGLLWLWTYRDPAEASLNATDVALLRADLWLPYGSTVSATSASRC